MPSNDAPWDIYAGQMIRAKLGVALWEPGPTSSYSIIRIGHVGYMRMGRFRMIFDANGPIGNRREGYDVPERFVPLPPEHTIAAEGSRPPLRLHMDYARRVGLEFEASTSPPTPAGAVFAFESCSSRGATLITQDWVKTMDAERERTFREYIQKYHASWITFAQDTGHDVELQDIIFVTGHDTTRDYAMAAFSDNSSALRLEFKAGMQGVLSASAAVWGSWEASPHVHRTCGPLTPFPHSTPSPSTPSPSTSRDGSQSPGSSEVDGPAVTEFNQCLFIRGFHMRKRMIFSPTVMKAAAGYDTLDVGDRREASSEPVRAREGTEETDQETPMEEDIVEPASISGSSTFTSPLDPLFEFIFERTSVDFALVHDLDIIRTANLANIDHFRDLPTLLEATSRGLVIDEDDNIARLLFTSSSITGISEHISVNPKSLFASLTSGTQDTNSASTHVGDLDDKGSEWSRSAGMQDFTERSHEEHPTPLSNLQPVDGLYFDRLLEPSIDTAMDSYSALLKNSNVQLDAESSMPQLRWDPMNRFTSTAFDGELTRFMDRLGQSSAEVESRSGSESKSLFIECNGCNYISLGRTLKADIRALVEPDDRGFLYGLGPKVTYVIALEDRANFTMQKSSCCSKKNAGFMYHTRERIVRDVAKVMHDFLKMHPGFHADSAFRGWPPSSTIDNFGLVELRKISRASIQIICQYCASPSPSVVYA